MRDEHGRYHTLREISANGPSWARGCSKCKHGIVSAPELTGACELYLERLVQAVDGDITFCDCQAGTRQRSNLANRFLALKDEVKRKPNLSWYVGRNTHPDIDSARKAMQQSYGYVKAPPIHFVQHAEPATPEPVLEPAL